MIFGSHSIASLEQGTTCLKYLLAKYTEMKASHCTASVVGLKDKKAMASWAIEIEEVTKNAKEIEAAEESEPLA